LSGGEIAVQNEWEFTKRAAAAAGLRGPPRRESCARARAAAQVARERGQERRVRRCCCGRQSPAGIVL